ncbi:MAG TPA: type III-A CRISPR-associated RAMP protein Csm5 [Syntrophomonadaceae bacterium]|nr:type III-A CRISPR-associated RAMP protein Csm5 [Syntrophomonadaceae bacterium]
MKYGHLERLDITLRTLAPLFIGSGESYTKKEYILDPDTRQIHFPYLPDLITYLKNRNCLQEYEKFLLRADKNDLGLFLKENKIRPKEYDEFVAYSIDAGEAIENEQFREVLTFMKDAYGLPYIPGSSLKGAIRTAIAAQLIKEDDFNWARRGIENADTSVRPRRYLSREDNNINRRIFFRLEHKDIRTNELIRNPINDFMQGIRVSDSHPLELINLTLVGKHERKPDGSVALLPIFRECLIPGSEAKLQITLDKPILAKAGITIDFIERALHNFADDHYESFEQHFEEKSEDAEIAANQGVDLILGGGAGFVSKTLIYNLYNEREMALARAAFILNKQFPPNHGHSKSLRLYKVAPHVLKTTKYKGQYYQMGRCELIIE